MENKTFKLAIRTDIKDKISSEDLKGSASGWLNVQLTLHELMDSVSNGFPFTHQFINGYRKGSNFAGTNALIADIDGTLSLERALADPFIKAHATLIYTTPSHTEAENRYRILFHLKRDIYDGESYEALYTALMKRVPTDPAAKSCAQFFFGNSEAIFHEIGKSLDNELINKMIREGMEERYIQSVHNPASTLTDDTRVSVKNRGLLLLRDLRENTSVLREKQHSSHPICLRSADAGHSGYGAPHGNRTLEQDGFVGWMWIEFEASINPETSPHFAGVVGIFGSPTSSRSGGCPASNSRLLKVPLARALRTSTVTANPTQTAPAPSMS
ncbi:hypothetical protein [Aestuariivirga sp.]|uniref:hypothetical protein n=1 Tax=Aestuariivirga sp. TaxID=2650926 RepID=UPI0030159951